MLGHVPGAAVVDAFEFAPAEREFVFDVDGGLRIVGELVVRMQVELFDRELQHVQVEVPAFLTPVLEPFHRAFVRAEEFHFHLREFAGAEREHAGRDLVAERLADLGDAEGQLHARGDADGVEIEIRDVVLVEDGADVGLHHQVEFAGRGKVLRAAVRAGGRVGHLVHAEARLALLAVAHDVAETVHVTGGFPDFRVADDGGVQADHVVAFFDHVEPPLAFDRALQGDPVGAVVPEAVEAAVDFGALKYEAAPFAQADDLFHAGINRLFRHDCEYTFSLFEV